MKTVLKILAVILIAWGVLFTIAGFFTDFNQGFGVAAVVGILIAGILPFIIGVLLFKKSKQITPQKREIRIAARGNLKKNIFVFFDEYKNNDLDWKSFVQVNIPDTKKSNKKKIAAFGLSLYTLALEKALKDLFISENEINKLHEIQQYFNLDNSAVMKIKLSFSADAINKLIELKLSDKIISEDEYQEIIDFGSFLGISSDNIDKIVSNKSMDVYKEYVRNISSDNKITSEEEKELSELAIKLNLDETRVNELLDAKTKKDLYYCRLMYQIEQDNLPVITAPIILQNNEICHFSIPANKLVVKTQRRTVGYSARVPRTSVRLYSSHPIAEKTTQEYSGTLFITNKRIVFTAAEKGFSIPLSKLTNIIPYKDGIGLQKDTTSHVMRFNDNCAELIGLIIQIAISKL
jgi:hypothetical protein